MKQSRLMSLAESVANAAVGFVVAVGGQLLVFPAVGLSVTPAQNLAIGGAFTAISIVRSYLLRRLFEAIRIATEDRKAVARPDGRRPFP